MKKSIFLMMFIAIFVGTLTEVSGQLCVPARAIDAACLPGNAINPVPGTPYDYTVNVPTPPGVKTFMWLVTTDQTFIEAGVLTGNIEYPAGQYLAAVGTGYADPLLGTATINLTWEYFDATVPVFLLIQVSNADPASCNTKNMKVYKILPANGFTIDIANIDQNGLMIPTYGVNYDFCVHDIVSATYNATAPIGVIYDFGEDSLYYMVNAANFSASWMPYVQPTAFAGMGVVSYVGWSRPTWPTFTWTPMNLAAGVYSPTNPVPALDASGTVGSVGECIVIVVVIDHSPAGVSYEGLTSTQVSVALDGKTQLAATPPLSDLHFSATLPAPNAFCGLADGFQFDIALQTINARTDIQDATTPPVGNDFLPVQP